MVFMIAKYVGFHSAENPKDILYYAYHLEDYELNLLDDNRYGFTPVGLGFHIKLTLPPLDINPRINIIN